MGISAIYHLLPFLFLHAHYQINKVTTNAMLDIFFTRAKIKIIKIEKVGR